MRRDQSLSVAAHNRSRCDESGQSWRVCAHCLLSYPEIGMQRPEAVAVLIEQMIEMGGF
jgi:hypothetical protein